MVSIYSFFASRGFRGSASGPQVCLQTPLSTEPSRLPLLCVWDKVIIGSTGWSWMHHLQLEWCLILFWVIGSPDFGREVVLHLRMSLKEVFCFPLCFLFSHTNLLCACSLELTRNEILCEILCHLHISYSKRWDGVFFSFRDSSPQLDLGNTWLLRASAASRLEM